jgi:hypothetical protein
LHPVVVRRVPRVVLATIAVKATPWRALHEDDVS